MTLREVLAKGVFILKNENINEPTVDSAVMLCHILRCDRAYLYAHADDWLEDEIINNYIEMVTERSKGVPVQYITGHQEFMSLDFIVEQGVLIPRQDTEILVEEVIGLSKQYDRAVKILEIGTGSGCIAVSLAYYINNCSITSLDISEKALDVACKNATKNKVDEKIEFIKSDMFNEVNQVKFDIIVSNPPYACTEEIKTLQREVREYEPVAALDGGEDGLYFYREIVAEAHEFLENNGYLAFEVGYNQANDVKHLMEDYYTQIKILKDLAGINRVVIGRIKNNIM